MKFLKAKYIVSTLIIIFIAVLLGLYFIGGLQVYSLEYDNLEFNPDEFIDFSTIQYDENGDVIEGLVIEYDNEKIVGRNDKYTMVFDEQTTIAKIIDNVTNEVLFQTAQDAENQTAANLRIDYARVSNGNRVSTQLNSFQHSVRFENSLTGEPESHYKIKYVDNGVQILYEIGKFSANIDYFPKVFHVANFAEETIEDFEGDQIHFIENKRSLEGRFQGNTFFDYDLTLSVQDGERIQILEYNNILFTYSPAAKDYLVENNLAIVDSEQYTYWRMIVTDPSLYDSFGTHLNSDSSPVYTNPFFAIDEFETLRGAYLRQPPNQNYDVNHHSRRSMGSTTQRTLYNFLYTNHQQMDVSTLSIPTYDIEGNPVMRGGFHAIDENGSFLYDDEGNPVQTLYSLEQVAYDNALFDEITDTSLERFQVAIEFKLTNEGLVTTILGDSLQDYSYGDVDADFDHDYLMSSITVIPEFTTSRNLDEDGMMIIPDGSGAFINFNNGKTALNYSAYNKTIYGRDMAFVLEERPLNSQTLMFNMFGYINSTRKNGILAIVEKGAGQTAIFADTPRGGSQRNTIHFSSNVRINETVTVGAGYNTTNFPKWSKNLSKNDFVYNYIILDESKLDYIGVAETYREYLMSRYDISEKDTTKNNLVNIDLLGAYEHDDLFLGVKYRKDDSLTSFEEAQKIVEELLANGIDNLAVGYTSWTKDGMEPEFRSNVKVSSVLGGSRGMETFNEYLKNNNISLFPEVNIASAQGYNYPFGNIKYTTRSVGNFYATHYPYNLATLLEEKSMTPTYYIAPQYYNSLIEKMLPSLTKLNTNAVYISDIGNTLVGNFRNNREVYSYGSQLYQIDALKTLSNTVSEIKLSAPFDYALPYADIVVDVPLESSNYGMLDGEIPLYHLVISGLFDYTTSYINGPEDKNVDWYFAKALTTGSNLNFILSYTDPIVLLETDYTQYYKTYYKNWRDTIIDLNERVNDAGIHNGKLVNHEIVDRNISRVTYEVANGDNIVLVVNNTNNAYNHNGYTIAPYGYLREGGE